MTSNLSKPKQYKNYLIWSDTAFDNMNYHTVGCGDTIKGVCINNISMEECINNSEGSGYYIKFKNDTSLCVPLKEKINSNLVYKLVNKKVHPELDDVSISVFLDKNKFPFPPSYTHIIFFFDILILQNSESNLFLNVKNNKNINFSENSETFLQFVPSKTYRKGFIEYDSINYGDEFSIVIPGTSLILSQNIYNENFEFVESTVYNQFTFKIYPLDKNGIYNPEKMNKPVSYKDNFTLIYSENNILTLDNYNNLKGVYGSIEQLIQRNDISIKNTFNAISKMENYYCNDNKCESTKNLKKDVLENLKFVCRNKDCWGICNYIDKKTQEIPPYTNIESISKYKDSNQIFYKKKYIMLILLLILASIIIFIILRHHIII